MISITGMYVCACYCFSQAAGVHLHTSVEMLWIIALYVACLGNRGICCASATLIGPVGAAQLMMQLRM